ncbi:cytidine deaminase, partial [Candidatus Woesearchaeota archaeon]|nr:cytidine deaminase [Candidatus Woesearchaeota archaeon]
EKETLKCTVEHMWYNELSSEDQELVTIARRIRPCAKPHISHYEVGVALRATNGEIYTGVNVESDIFTATVHAEVHALITAKSDFATGIDTLAVVVKDQSYFPCGLCRQVLYEFDPSARIIAASSNRDQVMVSTIEQLLPLGFRLQN